MEDELVSYKTAALAKRAGFEEYTQFICSAQLINPTKEDLFLNKKGYINKNIIAFPTQSLLHRWLREVHKIHITVYIGFGHKVWYSFFISKIAETQDKHTNVDGEEITETIQYESLLLNAGYDILDKEDDSCSFNTYEEALEVGLQESLKLINNHGNRLY